MEWKTVSVPIDPDIAYLMECIETMAPNSCLAGGYLSDRYMGREAKDVDIFIKHHEKRDGRISAMVKAEGGVSLESKEIDKQYRYKMAMKVESFTWRGHSVQLVFTDFGITAVKHFDFRFREFFHFRGTTYASKEALADINAKTLVFGVTKAPIVALHRLVKFKERYGFTVDEGSVSRLYQLVNEYQIPFGPIDTYLHRQAVMTPGLGTLLKEQANFDPRNHTGHLCFHRISSHDRLAPKVLAALLNAHVPRDVAERAAAQSKADRTLSNGHWLFSSNPYTEAVVTAGKKFTDRLEHEKLRLLLSGHDDWAEACKSKIRSFSEWTWEKKTTEYEQMTKEAMTILKVVPLSPDWAKVKNLAKICNLPVGYRVSNTIVSFDITRNIRSYADGELLEIELPYLKQSFLWNTRQKKVIRTRCYGVLEETFLPLIEELMEAHEKEAM